MDNINYIRPKVIISACLGFKKCRYDGSIENNDFINKLKDYVDFIPVCPEEEIGLGTPRSPVRIVNSHNNLMLFQPSTNKDYYKEMISFTKNYLNKMQDIDGFILKNRSPSCGPKDVKIYESIKKGSSYSKGKGIFGGFIVENCINKAVEDSGRLNNYKIRDHFYTKLFLLSNFHLIEREKNIDKLLEFHNNNLLLYYSYNKLQTDNLENKIKELVKENNKDNIFYNYSKCLNLIMARAPRKKSRINILKDIINMSNIIDRNEKEFIINIINGSEEDRIPFSVPFYLIKFVLYCKKKYYLLNQSFFNPYPSKLLQTVDSGKIKDYN